MTATAAAPRLLTRDDILAQRGHLPREVVEVPAWDGAVTVQALTGIDRDRYEAGSVILDNKGQPMGFRQEGKRARLLSLALVDDDGKKLFAERDIAALGEIDARPLDMLLEVALRLSGLTPNVVEERVENLKTDQNGSSGTD